MADSDEEIVAASLNGEGAAEERDDPEDADDSENEMPFQKGLKEKKGARKRGGNFEPGSADSVRINAERKLKGYGRTGKSAGRATQVKAGLKKCKDCNKDKPMMCFKPGNAVCTQPCLQVKDNIYNACKAANNIPWFQEQRGCPHKWKKVTAWYKKQCCPKEMTKDAKMQNFKVLQYQSHVEAQQQALRDGTREMMHVA